MYLTQVLGRWAIFLFFSISVVSAADGDLADGYGNHGFVTAPRWPGKTYANINQVKMQWDGKAVVSGFLSSTSYLARLNPDGKPDLSFGEQGSLLVNYNGVAGSVNAIALTATGKILVAGGTQNSVERKIVLARYNSNGQLDNSFDSDGLVAVDLGTSSDAAHAITELSDGRILVAGESGFGSVLLAFNADGSVDQTFGTQGRVVLALPNGVGRWNAVMTQNDGRIVLVGQVKNDAVLARFFSNGSLDTGFSNGGMFVTPIGYGAEMTSLAIQADGKIVAAGSINQTQVFSGLDMLVLRLTNDGALDVSFDGDGFQEIEISARHNRTGLKGLDQANSVVLQSDQMIVLVGYSDDDDGSDLSMARLTTQGALDTQFSDDGVDQFDSGLRYDYGRAAQLLPSGEIWAFADGEDSGKRDPFNVRWLSSGARNLQWGANGIQHMVIESNRAALWTDIDYEVSGAMVMTGRVESYDGMTMGLVRYLDNGMLDSSFGVNGRAEAHFGNLPSLPYSITSQRDGKKIVAGFVESVGQRDFALARFSRDGILDSAFGDQGNKIISFGAGNDVVNDVAIRDDDVIIVAGTAKTSSNTYDAAVVALQSDGNLLPSFGVQGRAVIDLGAGPDQVKAVALQSDNKIIVAGSTAIDGKWNAVVARLNSNGTLDTTFANGGFFRYTDGAIGAFAEAAQVLSDDSIVIAGYADYHVLLMKINANGSIDTGFAEQGIAYSDTVAQRSGWARALTVHGDGRIFIAGAHENDMVLWRFNADGQYDSSFDTSSKLRNLTTLSYNDAYAVEIALDGDLIVAGGCNQGGLACVARYENNGVGSAQLSPHNLQLADTIVQQTSAAKSVRLRNVGTGAVRLDDLSVSGTVFSAQNNCPIWMRPTAFCEIELRFSPQEERLYNESVQIITDTQNLMTQLSGLGLPTDFDRDGIPDRDDADDDNDGVNDRDDAFPFDASEWLDTDHDGQGNNRDADDDGDGVADDDDLFPLDSTEQNDNDQDGSGNNADSDDDGDGIVDGLDLYPLFNQQHLPMQRATHLFNFDYRTLVDWVSGQQQLISRATSTEFVADRLAGQALNAVRQQGYFELPDDFSDAYFSLSFWYRMPALSGETIVLANKNSGDNAAAGFVLSDQNNALQLQISDGARQLQSNWLSYPANTWILVALQMNQDRSGMRLSVVTSPTRVKSHSIAQSGLTLANIWSRKNLLAESVRLNEDRSNIANLANPQTLQFDELTTWQADLSGISLFALANAPNALDHYLPVRALDTDNDGLPNALDGDDDNDGVNDDIDAFPLDASESVDSDHDGLGNNADPDDDNDRVNDDIDAFPLDINESVDTDRDGIGNNADTDDDNDGVNDIADAFPLDVSESVDTDHDGLGNNADTDDDNDGHLDADDKYPLDPTRWRDETATSGSSSGGGGGGSGSIFAASLCILLYAARRRRLQV